ncbi:uncharacterized protein LOC132543688 isoform X2 [Ylistrum balloti]|uniref:uncharacterized protein LOC132543688 isoform X2 n=1 Tax=Ylistrum balloti TaxID=509963 RepID=UPI0029058B92|nr:uncharacterized protein LOC132543688 isoform X2 [Ylistrum balloti]
MEIVFLFTLFCIPDVLGSMFYVIPQLMSPSEAVKACKDNNSELAIPDTEDEELLNILKEIDENGAWTGQYVNVAPWAYARGCWRDFDTTTSFNISNNSGSACLQSCGPEFDTAFVKGEECVCTQQPYATKTNYYFCQKACEGDRGACGGINTHTQYTRCFLNTCPEESDLRHNCAYIYLNGTSRTALCEEEHIPICLTGSNGELIANVSRKMSWIKSNEFCREQDANLADVSQNQDVEKSLKRQNSNYSSSTTFWVALSRANTQTISIAGNTSFNTSSRCSYIQNNDHDVKMRNCSDRAFAVCKANLDDKDQVFGNKETNQGFDNGNSTTDSTSSLPTVNLSIVYIILGTVLAVAFIGIIVGTSILVKRRMKSKRTPHQQSHPHYDYTEMQHVQSTDASGLRVAASSVTDPTASNNTNSDNEMRIQDEGNYDKLGDGFTSKQISNVSNSYDSARPLQEGIYNDLQEGRERDNGVRDSFYATSQSCSTTEGNYDLFQKRDVATGAESEYDHVVHPKD